jgi:hypothetical protein
MELVIKYVLEYGTGTNGVIYDSVIRSLMQNFLSQISFKQMIHFIPELFLDTM